MLHLVGFSLTSQFAHDARSQKPKAPVYRNLRHLKLATPRPLYATEGSFITHLKGLGNTAVQDGVAKRILPRSGNRTPRLWSPIAQPNPYID